MTARRLEVQDYSIAPNTEISLTYRGDYFRCLDANIAFKVGLGDDEFTNFEKGLAFEGSEFEIIRIKNTSGVTTLNIEIGVAFGRIDDNRLTITEPIVVRSGDNIDNGKVTVGTSEILLVPANTDRTGLTIFNNHSTGILYVGRTGVSATDGIPVQPKGSLSIANGGEVKVIGDTASMDIRYLEELV